MTGRGIGAAVTLVLVLLIGLGTGLREVYFIVFVLDILLLYACCQSLEIIKCIIGTVMVKKGIWINNIVADKKGEV